MAEHEARVAERCSTFLKRIHPDLAPWGELLGRWHDLGKYSEAFQDYICRSDDPDASSETRRGRVDHATAGAQHAFAVLQPCIRDLFAYTIAGHHAGLTDRVSATGQGSSGLNARLNKSIEDWSAAPEAILEPQELALPVEKLSQISVERCGFQLSLLCRMVFSALCDADFLATEQFISPDAAKQREVRRIPTIDELLSQLETYLQRFDDPTISVASNVNTCRAEVLQAAKTASRLSPGFFSFTVPTGGGKTLSSLAFALRHAAKHGHQRVVYAIPFTSIIEQTADIFREVFEPLGSDVVLEHHSNLDPDEESRVSRLAAQNWDAPLVVTTNVQFFESILANRTSRCRKLHRIAGSVIIFDEVQTLPVKYLTPCLAVIRELVEMFGCTVVLCTATQPAIRDRDDFEIGLQDVREIVDEPRTLYERMKRVRVDDLRSVDDETLVEKIATMEQTLCVVNTRPHASELYASLRAKLDNDTVFHLSTYMCAAHRKENLDKIKRRLRNGEPCRVVSTQLIEAGVDIDFPTVFRSHSGLDSIAQAAGRCNREGRHPLGILYLFEPKGRNLVGYLRSTAQTASEVIPLYRDIMSLDAIDHYFRLHYWDKKDAWDQQSIMSMFADPMHLTFQFRSAAEQFRFIENAAKNLFVPWSETGALLDAQLRCAAFEENTGFRRNVLRRVQRFVVPVYENVFTSMIGTDIELINDNLGVLLNMDMYSQQLGLELAKQGYYEPESLVVA